MFRQIFILTLLVAFVSAGIVGNYVDCGSTSTVNQLRVSGCDGSPCLFTKGSSYTIEMDATASTTSNTLPYSFFYTISHSPVKPISRNVCNDLASGSCPIYAGQSFSFGSNIEVSSNFQEINTRVGVFVSEGNNKTICVEFSVHIRNPQLQTL